jgi:hypothetical protein
LSHFKRPKAVEFGELPKAATVSILGVAPSDPVCLREQRLSRAELTMRVFEEDLLQRIKCRGKPAAM